MDWIENDSHSHNEWAGGVPEELHLLLALPDRLCPGHWARAIRFAGALGRASAGYLGSTIRDGIEAGHLPFLKSETYLEMVLRPSLPETLMEPADLEAWEAAFEDGRASSDPRVQAFTSGLAERVSEITHTVLKRRRVLARYLEVPLASLSVSGILPEGIPLFDGREGCFLVTDAEEAARLGSGEIRALCGRTGRPCDVESCPFLDLLIHRSRN